MMNLPTGTVTFLFTDIEGSTKLAREHPDQWEDMRTRHHALMREAIEAQHGYVFQIIGDAFCASFHTARDAITAVLNAQRALQQEQWRTAPINVRMGLHTGAARAEGLDPVSGGYVGYMTMAMTQRIMSTAYGGQVLLSQSAAELVRRELPNEIMLRDMGEHQLKGLINAEHLWQVVAPDLQQDFPPLKTLNTIPHNLPEALTSFIGREANIAEVERLLSTQRLVTLTGPGGTGKTRLALEVAQRSLEKFRAGAWLVELAPIDRDESVAAAVASAIGVHAQPPRAIEETIVDALQDRALLLIIDNCEHVLSGAAQLVAKILQHCPITKLITTSREPLHVAGEHLYAVPGMNLPTSTQTIEQLTEVDAVRLLIDRALAVRSDFALEANNTADVITICRSLDGMPLAIELAAARLRMMSLREIVQRLDQRLRLLTGGPQSARPRHQTLQAAIAWSYDLLPSAERVVFNRLSVFHGGCTLDAAERVCAGDGVESNEVFDWITSLVDKSMVVADLSTDGTTRYRLLETLRQYGHERLIEANQENIVYQRYANYYAELVEQLDAWLWGAQWTYVPGRWQAEEDNIFAAMSWSATYGDGVLALRIGGAGRDSKDNWSHHRWSEYKEYMLKSMAKDSEILAKYKAKALISIGRSHQDSGEPERAREYCEKGLVLAQQLDDRSLLAQALFWLANSELGLGQLDQARVHAAQCVEIGRETNTAIWLWPLVWLCELEPAERQQAILEEFLDVSQRTGAICLGRAYQFLAEFFLRMGYLTRAERLFEECTRHVSAVRIQDRGMMVTSAGLGRIALLRGDYTQAMSLFETGRHLWRINGWEDEFASFTRWLGVVAWYQHDYDTATLRYHESCQITQRRSTRDETAVTSIYQAILLRDQGDYLRARLLCDESLQVIRQFNFKNWIGWGLSVQASIIQRVGESAQAVQTYRESLAYFHESADRITRVEIIEGLGCALAEAKEYTEAIHLLAFAESQRNQMGIILQPPDRPPHNKAIEILREALEAETFSQAWQTGQALTIEQAMAMVLGDTIGVNTTKSV